PAGDRRGGERAGHAVVVLRPGGAAGPDRAGPQLCPRCPARRRGGAVVPGGEVLMVHADPGHFPWLTVVTFAPLAGAVPLAFVPARASRVAKLWALAVTVVTFGLSLGMLAVYRGGHSGLQLLEGVT